MGAYFKLNYPDAPEEKWPELKVKFFEFLIQHQEEWKATKETTPLDYLPYMES